MLPPPAADDRRTHPDRQRQSRRRDEHTKRIGGGARFNPSSLPLSGGSRRACICAHRLACARGCLLRTRRVQSAAPPFFAALPSGLFADRAQRAVPTTGRWTPQLLRPGGCYMLIPVMNASPTAFPHRRLPRLAEAVSKGRPPHPFRCDLARNIPFNPGLITGPESAAMPRTPRAAPANGSSVVAQRLECGLFRRFFRNRRICRTPAPMADLRAVLISGDRANPARAK
jgi:hypothetical protein